MTLATFATPERTHTRTHAATRLVNYEGFDYESFWDEPGRRHLDALEHRVVAELLPARGRRILDLGCGFGRLTDVYVERFDEVVLVDLARSQLEVARERWGSRVTLIQADLLAPPFLPGSFDACLLVRVLHHLPGPGVAFGALRRIVAPGGRVVLNSSNKRNALRIARYVLLGRGPDPFAAGTVRYGPRSYGCHPDDVDRALRTSRFTPLAWRGVGVVDKIAASLGPLGHAVPTGAALSRVLGRVRIAPSLFCAAERDGRPVALPDPFACPECRAALSSSDGELRCIPCDRRFERRDGIWDLRA